MTKAKSSRVLTTTALVLLALASCTHDGERASTTVTTGAQPMMNDDAAMRLTETRCEREAACKNIGRGHAYADESTCTRELFRSSAALLSTNACPAGIDEQKLSRCRAEVRSAACGDVLDPVERLASCQRNELCVRW